MKLLLLKTLLQRRARDEGFTLPMVIALGLVMVLLGMANIVKSGEENLNATIQNSSSDALAIAEVGITKYREFLNQNRILTVYNHDVWDSDDVDITFNGISIDGIDVAGQTCIDMAGAPTGWTGTATKPNDTAAEASDKDGTDNDNWWEIREDINGDGDTVDPEDLIGEYRLVSYTYDNDNNLATNNNGDFNNLADVNPDYPTDTSNDNDTNDDGESDARGILKVQGRSPDESVAQIQVDIPLRINTDEMQNLAPAIWIGDGNSDNLGTLTIPSDMNIVLTDDASGCDDPNVPGISAISDARAIPLLNSINAKFTEAGTANINEPGSLPATLGTTGDRAFVTPPAGETFNQTNHCRNISNCRYYYRFTAPVDTNAPIETDGIAKVTVYIDGDLNIDQDIIGSGVSSDYLEIYVEGNRNITIDSNSVNTVKAFINAPESKLTISGSGTVNIIGSVWVKEFDNKATVNFGVLDSGIYETETTKIDSRTRVPTYEVYTTTGTRPPRPLTSSPTNWVREEVE
ncbi:MAG: hypothetical protein AAF383_17705 [Cyanobacteria bacterium P01_A01_bin.83]